MPFWDHFFNKPGSSTENKDRQEAVQIAQAGRHALAQSVDARTDPAVGALLKLLWSDDITSQVPAYAALTAAQDEWSFQLVQVTSGFPTEYVTWSEGAIARELATFLRARTSEPPSTPEARYAAVVGALQAMLHANMSKLEQSGELYPVKYLDFAVRAAYMLRAAEVEDLCCELLITADRAIIKERNGSRSGILQQLAQDLRAYFLVLPPEAMPGFWARLKSESTSAKFWPVVTRMRDRRAVPYLLDALRAASFSPDAQSNILTALGNIKDARVVPVLQETAADPQNLAAPQAAQILKDILRSSREDAAQLLRPTDARHAGNAGETLLRPAAASGAETPSTELLRPSEASDEDARESEDVRPPLER